MSIQLQEIQSIYISQNRLVEWKDYKRAEWLKGDGSAVINTKLYIEDYRTVTLSVRVKEFIRYTEASYIVAAGAVAGSGYGFNFSVARSDTANQYRITTANNSVINICSLDGEHTLEIKDSKIYADDVEKVSAFEYRPLQGRSLGLYGNVSGSTHASNGYISNFSLQSSVGNLNLTPCQLLQDIPATLDANGIARIAGECGMVDSISGKFYGNVASSGSFSVEGLDESDTVEDTRLHQIYRNKLVEGEDYMVGEMLKGTGGCYIDTLINPAWNDTLSVTTKVSGIPTVNNPYILSARGTNAFVGFILGGAWYKENATQFIVINKIVGTDDYFLYQSFPADAELYATFEVLNNSRPTVSFKVNGASWTNRAIIGTNIITELPNSTYKIGRDTANGLDVLNLKNIKINSHNFVPCKLLRPIPRNLDAQCKARQAGECGMIDLVSGRFYGNVAERGAFSLAYDKWLKDCSIQLGQLPYSINTIPPHIEYHTRIKVSKLTAEYQDFGFCKLSLTKIAVGDNYPQEWDFSNWGTSEWATVVITYTDGAYATCYVNDVNVTGTQTTQIPPIYQNVHIILGETMQLSKIIYQYTIDTSDILGEQIIFTRYVDENTGQQGLISDQDETIIYAD